MWMAWGGARLCAIPGKWLESLTTESIVNGAIPVGASTYRFVFRTSGSPVVFTIQFWQICIVKTTGLPEVLNTNLYVDAPTGMAPFTIDSVVSDSSHFPGIAHKRAPPQAIHIRDNAIHGGTQRGLVVRAGYNPLNTISGNTINGNHYALDLVADALPVLGANTLGGNVTDTLLLHGGTLPVSHTLPQLGFRWRVTQPMVVDAGATLTVLAGDTVAFDDLASLTIGGAPPAALNPAGAAGAGGPVSPAP